jgi:hypothetical protein
MFKDANRVDRIEYLIFQLGQIGLKLTANDSHLWVKANKILKLRRSTSGTIVRVDNGHAVTKFREQRGNHRLTRAYFEQAGPYWKQPEGSFDGPGAL